MHLQRFQHYIDGVFEDAKDVFESINPATGLAWALMPAASADDVDRAVKAAHLAFTDSAWSRMQAGQRGKLLYRLADLLAANVEQLAELETTDTGKIRRETRAQILYIAEYYRYYAGLADKLQGAHFLIDKEEMESYTRREPIGVVAAIVPWNSQLFLSAVKLAPALAAGCAVVLKASEDGPAPLLAFARIVHEAGFPAGAVNVLTGFGQTCGLALTRHPLIAKIAFTGGPSTARNIVRNSAENLASTSLELGGKSPVIVFEDADLDSTANAIISGIFAATGQSCVAGSRLLVQASVHALVTRKTWTPKWALWPLPANVRTSNTSCRKAWPPEPICALADAYQPDTQKAFTTRQPFWTARRQVRLAYRKSCLAPSSVCFSSQMRHTQ
jgi:acyl-CoA reductase-like NAD-dependent aldehyde dehydrogenase